MSIRSPVLVSDSHAHIAPQGRGRSTAAVTETRANASTDLCCGSGANAGGGQVSEVAPASFSLSRVVLCGTHPALDWDAVSELASSADQQQPISRQVIPGFGVHPWYVPELPPTETHGPMEPQPQLAGTAPNTAASDTTDFNAFTAHELLAQLEAKLQAYPHAIVGEIGLDKLRGPSQAAQQHFFLEQVKLAAKYNRPVSVHCVRHYGLLLELLDKTLTYKEDVPPAIVIHGFSGSCSVAQSLLKMKNKKVSRPEVPEAGCATAGTLNDFNTCVGKGGVGDDAGSEPAGQGAVNQPSHVRRTGSAAKDVVKISERLYFGVGAATSLTVKDCAGATLPLLLRSQRALIETDRFYDAAGFCVGAGASCDNNKASQEIAAAEWAEVVQLLSPVVVAATRASRTTTSTMSAAAQPMPAICTFAQPQSESQQQLQEPEAQAAAVTAMADALERTFDNAFAAVLQRV